MWKVKADFEKKEKEKEDSLKELIKTSLKKNENSQNELQSPAKV